MVRDLSGRRQRWPVYLPDPGMAPEIWSVLRYCVLTLSSRALLLTIAGPIIRINPTELHISDPDFYDVVYSSSTPYAKAKAWRDRFGIPFAVQSTVEHDVHHHRRLALNPYFSKKQINDFTPYIQERATQLCERLLREYKGTSKVVTVNDAWAAFATDVIMYYGFAWSYDFLSYPDFIAPFTN